MDDGIGGGFHDLCAAPDALDEHPLVGKQRFGLLRSLADNRSAVADPERTQLVLVPGSASATRLFRASGESLQPVIAEVMSLIQRYGPDSVVALAARELPPELHGPAFALAVDLVLADGQAGPQERKFIDTLQALLHIPEQDAIKVVEVMLVKNGA